MLSLPLRYRRGDEPPAALAVPATVVPGGAASPRRHLHALPRGRGPSQTPPSLATDSSISPGPPSPWLPALHPVNKQKPLVVQVPPPAKPWGCKGRSPLHKKVKNLPLPRRGRGLGGMGAENQAKGRGGRRPKQPRHPTRQRGDRVGRRQTKHATPADSRTARSAGNQPGKPPASA